MTQDKMQTGQRMTRIGMALGIGAVGGAIFNYLSMPLPWMLGALVFNTIAATAGIPIVGPSRMRNVVVVVIGVMLGSGFTPDLFSQVGAWLLSLSFLAVYLFIAGVIVVPYYMLIGKFDLASAYFAGMPGGLSEMILIGRDMGGDERKIALAHASRVVITVMLLALWFRFGAGLQVEERGAVGVPFAAIPATEILILTGCGVFGYFTGRILHLPAPTLVGPMIFSALAHIFEFSTTPPPQELVILAQLVLGTIVGCRFVGSTARQIGHAITLSIGATIITLSVTLCFALLMHQLFAQNVNQVLLAYAPGGLAEMSLIALAMGAEVDYVALHHIVRITIIVIIAPLIFRFLRAKVGAPNN